MITNSELIDSIIKDCNESVKAVASGQYILWCSYISNIAIKLNNLKSGVEKEIANRNETIEKLKESLRNAGQTVEDMPPEEFISRMKGDSDGEN